MIITLKHNATPAQYALLARAVEERGLTPDRIRELGNGGPPIIGVRGKCANVSTDDFAKYDFVDKVTRISEKAKLASRSYHPDDTIVEVGGIRIGGNNPVVIMAGPCAVESKEQVDRIASEVKSVGADILRGGAFKPRTYPGEFEGLEEEGLKYLLEAGRKNGMPVITEVMDSRDIPLIREYADIFQVGTRNMQNFRLLDDLGRESKPILLKRGMAATIDEFLGSAERILARGNKNVILCLRGIRTFETNMRATPDLGALPYLLEKTHLPVVVDPSHSAGNRKWVESISRMAVVGGAHGLIIETHYNPEEARCDGPQMILPATLREIVRYSKTAERPNYFTH